MYFYDDADNDKELLLSLGENKNISMNFGDIMPPASSMTDFYRYNGSLTTPVCNEAVIWTVFEEKLKISSAQVGSSNSCL